MKTFIPKGNIFGPIVPFFIIKRKMSVGSKMLYAVLCSYAGDHDYCVVYQQTLAGHLSCSVNSIKKYLSELVEEKLIHIETTQHRHSIFYLLRPDGDDTPDGGRNNPNARTKSFNDVTFNDCPSEIDTQLSNFDSQPSKFDGKSSKIGYSNKINIKNTNPPLPPENGAGDSSFSGKAISGVRWVFLVANKAFEMLWAIYPRREGKELARAIWHKLWKKGSLPALDVLLAIINRLRSSANWLKEHGRYVPMLSNWLKGQRWLDEQPAEELPSTEDKAWQERSNRILIELEQRKKTEAEKSDALRPLFEAFFARFSDHSGRGPVWGLWVHMHSKGLAPLASDVPHDNTLPPLQFLQKRQREIPLAA